MLDKTNLNQSALLNVPRFSKMFQSDHDYILLDYMRSTFVHFPL